MPSGIYNDVAISPQFNNALIKEKIALTSNKLNTRPMRISSNLSVAPRLLASIRYIGVVGATTGNNDPFFNYYNLGAASPRWVDAVNSASVGLVRRTL